MSNLILANTKRLLKTKAFRITSGVIAVMALFQILMNYRDYVAGYGTPYFDSAMFSIAAIGTFAIAAVVALYVGSEFSDGTLRNKVIVGHSRLTIYLSLLITSILAGWMLVFVWSVFYLIPGVILMQAANPLWIYLLLYLALFCEMTVFAALFTWITMTIGNKSAAAVVCIMIALAFMLHGIVCKSILDEPEYVSADTVIQVTEDEETTYESEQLPNPNYLPEGSPKRDFYEFMLDFMPGGQALLIAGHQVDHVKNICLYDMGWIVLLTGAGVLIFRKKSLK